MFLDEATAVYLYLKDNTEAWAEPGKSKLEEARRTINEYARKVIARGDHEQKPQ